MRILLCLWCLLELCSLVISQSIPIFRLINIGNDSSANTDFQTMLQAKHRKDFIRRKILAILNLNDTSTPHPPTAKPPLPKDNTPDNPILSEPADFTNKSSCMQFKVPHGYFSPNVELSDGDIKVFIKVKKRKNKRKRKVSLKISLINENNKPITIASRKFRLKSTNWQHIHLGSTLIKSIQKQRMEVLKICIHCNKCNRKVQVEFPTKRKNKRRRKNRRRRKQRKLKLRKNRPRLLLYSKRTDSNVRHRRHAVIKRSASECFTQARFIPFSSLQLPQEIEYPGGFIFEQCTPMRSKNDVLRTETNDVTDCKGAKTEPLNLHIKFKDGIQFNMSIPNAKVTKCHIQ